MKRLSNEQIMDYLDGTLGVAERARVEAHLQTNAEDAAMVRELRFALGAAQDWHAQDEMRVNENFWPKLRDNLGPVPQRSWWSRLIGPARGGPATKPATRWSFGAALAAIVLALGAMFFAPQNAQTPAVAISAADKAFITQSVQKHEAYVTSQNLPGDASARERAPPTRTTPKMRFPNFSTMRGTGAEKTAATPLVFSAFLLGAFIIPALPARAQNMPAAATLIAQMQTAEKTAQYSATLFIARDGRRETAHVYRSGLKRRWEWTAPALKAGDVLVDNGANLYLYHASEKSVTVTGTTPRLANLGDGWKVAKGSDGNFVLSRGAQQLTLDGQRRVLLRFQIGGSVYALQNIKFGPQPASKFSFQTPANAKVVRSQGKLFVDVASARAAAPWLKAPAQLPAGYALESAIAAPDEVWLRYTNGKRRFSMFEQKAEAGIVALRKVKGGWFWKNGGVRYLVSGAPEGDVKSLAASLK